MIKTCLTDGRNSICHTPSLFDYIPDGKAKFEFLKLSKLFNTMPKYLLQSMKYKDAHAKLCSSLM